MECTLALSLGALCAVAVEVSVRGSVPWWGPGVSHRESPLGGRVGKDASLFSGQTTSVLTVNSSNNGCHSLSC